MRIKNASCLWLNKALKRYGLYEDIQEKENTRIKEKHRPCLFTVKLFRNNISVGSNSFTLSSSVRNLSTTLEGKLLKYNFPEIHT